MELKWNFKYNSDRTSSPGPWYFIIFANFCGKYSYHSQFQTTKVKALGFVKPRQIL